MLNNFILFNETRFHITGFLKDSVYFLRPNCISAILSISDWSTAIFPIFNGSEKKKNPI